MSSRDDEYDYLFKGKLRFVVGAVVVMSRW